MSSNAGVRRSSWTAAAGLVVLSAALLVVPGQGTQAELNGPAPRDRQVTKSVAILLQRYHFARRPLDDELSERALEGFLKSLDPLKIHFFQSDVQEFNKYRQEIDDQLSDGDISLAYDIFERFLQRVDQRIAITDKLLAQEHDFTVDESLITDRELLDYPANEQEAEERWRKRVKYDLLVLTSDEELEGDPRERLTRRYHSFAKRMHQFDSDELLEMFLSSMTQGYDPHTSFMSASTLTNFEIEMKKELDGIGASLQYDDGYTVVHKIIPGGAADRDGELKPKDRIIAVGEGESGELVDVVDMKLGDVVKLIRGKRGTTVRLTVIREGTNRKTLDITRDRIELKDSVARSEIAKGGQKPDGSQYLVGVIDLPSFYMDMEGARLGKPDYRSTTRDVRKILKDFNEKGVDAVIMDLRRNGGGSLTEAVNLTGLFIEQGPVVQVKSFNGAVEPYDDRDPEMLWTGPLVVWTSKFSASASEIFAGAIQDYRRGIVIGDETTHGKGTVQQLLDLGRQIFRVPNAPKLGALKITIQQFYRPSGDSTQNRGVVSDVELPSITTHLDVGEADLDYALAFDRVEPASHKDYGLVHPNIVANLRSASQKRISASEDFQRVMRSIESYKERKEDKTVPLNKEAFIAEQEQREAETEGLEDDEPAGPNAPVVKKDHYFKEAMAITMDYVEQLEKQKLAAK